MFYIKFFLIICLLTINYFMWSDCYETSDFRPKHTRTLSGLINPQSDHVQINHEHIPTITRQSFRYGRVKKLGIEYCQVRTIEDGAFRHLTSLKKLSLKNNLLREIKKGVFSNLDIEELDLSKNQIEVIEEKAFEYMRKLKIINLKYNKIEVYNNKWFTSASDLCSINFANNLIKSLPSNVIGSKFSRDCTVDVIFSNNSIENIDKKALDGGFAKFDRVYLDHNAITTLPKEIFFYPDKINFLRLDHNNIVCSTGRWISHIEDYDVDYNPWNEECLAAFKDGRDFSSFSLTATPRTTSKRISTRRRHQVDRHYFNRFD